MCKRMHSQIDALFCLKLRRSTSPMNLKETKLEGVRFGGLFCMPEVMHPSGGYNCRSYSKIDDVHLRFCEDSFPPHPLDGVSSRYTCTSLSISPRGDRVALLDFKGFVHVYGLQGGVEVVDPPLATPCFVGSCSTTRPVQIHYVNDDTVLVQYSDSVWVCHLDSGKQYCVFKVHGNVVVDCAYDPSRKQIVIVEHGNVVLIVLNIPRSVIFRERKVRMAGAEAVCFSSDGDWVYVATNSYVGNLAVERTKRMHAIHWETSRDRVLYDITEWSFKQKMARFDESHIVVDEALVCIDTGTVVCRLAPSLAVFSAGPGAVIACRHQPLAPSHVDNLQWQHGLYILNPIFRIPDPLLWLIKDPWETSMRRSWVTACVDVDASVGGDEADMVGADDERTGDDDLEDVHKTLRAGEKMDAGDGGKRTTR